MARDSETSDEFLIPVPFGPDFLYLTAKEIERGRARGGERDAAPAIGPPDPWDRIVDVHELAEILGGRTGKPTWQWWNERARRGELPPGAVLEYPGGNVRRFHLGKCRAWFEQGYADRVKPPETHRRKVRAVK